jgi:hypothetical protein
MGWPLSQDYNEAIQAPQLSFSDPELRAGQAVINALGLPVPCSGNFADVYPFECPQTGAKWAIKCFTREVCDRQERYAEISRYLEQARRPYSVDFQYLEQGIRVRGTWYPILKMQWVEGLLLNEFVRDMLDRPGRLEALSQVWARMARSLDKQGVAHADLQHGNVILVPGKKDNSLTIKLIDYDGMFVPALAGKPSGEVGHANYQHPQRLREGTYNAAVDRFPLLVVATALRALIIGGRSLWERYDNADNLLFRLEDLRAPRESALIWELVNLNDPELSQLADCLSRAVYKPLEQTPLLTEVGAKNGGFPPRPEEQPKSEEWWVQDTPGTLIPPVPQTVVVERVLPGDASAGGHTGASSEGNPVQSLPAAPAKVIAAPVNFDFSEVDQAIALRRQRAKRHMRNVLIGVAAVGMAIVGMVFGVVGLRLPTGSKRAREATPAQVDERPGVNEKEQKQALKVKPVEKPDGPEEKKPVDERSRIKKAAGLEGEIEAEGQLDDASVVARLEKLGARVSRNDKLPGKPVTMVLFSGPRVSDADLKELAPLKGLETLHLNFTRMTDAGLKELAPLTGLQTLIITGGNVTDAGLKELVALKRLHTLHLTNSKVSDAGMTDIAKLQSLQSLSLSWSKVTDAGIKDLARLESLRSLGLAFTGVTDAGLRDFASFKALKSLVLSGSKVTDAGVKDLRKVLPTCRVIFAAIPAVEERRMSWTNTDLKYMQFRLESGKNWVELHSQTGQIHKKWTEVGRTAVYIELQEDGQDHFARLYSNRVVWGRSTVGGKRQWETGPSGSWQR